MRPPLATDLNGFSLEWVEIPLLFLVIYAFLRFLRKTVAGGIVRGPALLLWAVVIVVFYAVRTFQFEVLEWLLARAVPLFILSLVVIFQPEFRHGLARLAEARLFKRFGGRKDARPEEIRAVDELIAAVTSFAGRQTGALIVIERTVDLGTYVDTGVRLDAILRAETLDTIFTTKTLLHDGAVIIRGDRIAAAGCLLPLTERPHLARRYGTRHRAAIGLSEQSDALVVVVSEETGSIHIAERGELESFKDVEWLTALLSTVMAEKQGVAPVAP
jgi:diadenylate cyclase